MSRGFRALALESAAGGCSVALSWDGDLQVRREERSSARARLVLQQVSELLAESGASLGQLDCIVFGRGPGSFTGVRIAAAAAQGLAFGAGLPVVAISSLAGMARAGADQAGPGVYAPSLDARQGEIYLGVYQCSAPDEAVELEPDCLTRPGAWSPPQGIEGQVVAVGPGWSTWPGILDDPVMLPGPPLMPGAAELARLGAVRFAAGDVLEPQAALPNYIRTRVADS